MNVPNIAFSKAISETQSLRRHLLLGNGFSMEAYQGFGYRSLAEVARSLEPALADVFPPPLTNFEEAMRSADPVAAAQIRDGLIKAIKHTHPKWAEIATQRKNACADFLAKFLRERTKRGTIFTTNYDMMLYWVLVMHRRKLRWGDDFNRITRRWQGGRKNALLYYLHGALHLYQRPSGSPLLPIIGKLMASSRTDLIDSIRTSIDGGQSPILVSEGTAEQKWQQIRQNNYLRSAFSRFQAACNSPDSVLFTFGHGLSDFDRHIAAQICRGKLQRVYISIFNDGGVDPVAKLADGWAQWRRSQFLPPIDVRTFRSSEAEAWGQDPSPETAQGAR